MSTPRFVPSHAAARAARAARVTDFAGTPPARRTPLRPAAGRRPPRAPGFGLPCPDAGYALLLADLTVERVTLEPVERREDAVSAIATIAIRRAAVLGRAPFMGDVAVARSLLAYDGDGPSEFTGWRARHLAGVAHDPGLQQRLADVAMPAIESGDPVAANVLRTWREALRQSLL
jgi:hypothetical protein